MERKTKTAEEWRIILEDQKQRKLTDQVCANEHDVSVWTLRNRKKRQSEKAETHSELIEVPFSVTAGANLKIVLTNGIRLEVPSLLSPQWLGTVVTVMGRL